MSALLVDIDIPVPERATPPLSKERAKRLAMVVLPKADAARRSRAADSKRLLAYWLDRVEVRPVSEDGMCFDVECNISVKEAARAIGLSPAMWNPTGNRRHYTDDQLRYLTTLIEDIPRTLRRALGLCLERR